MSCWKENKLGLNVIANAIELSNITPLSYADIFKVLAKTNNESVNYRYSERKHAVKFDAAQFELDQNKHYSIVQLIKAIDCLNYQCCEKPRYESSQCKKLLDECRTVLVKKWHQSHFEYESFNDAYDLSDWGITETTPQITMEVSSHETIQGYSSKVVNK